MIRAIYMHETFAEHATLSVDLEFPTSVPIMQTWPKPQPIPWHQVDPAWASQNEEPYATQGSVEERYAQIFGDLENSLDGYITREGPPKLVQLERGRAQQLGPRRAPPCATCPKPSREGEVRMRSNLVGMEVIRWFKQLRRLESLKHSLLAAKQTPEAVAYRTEVWSAILHAKGFAGGFLHWWSVARLHGVEGAPAILSRTLPSSESIILIFESFKKCYEQFESWHLRARGRQLRAKYELSTKSIFMDLKDASKDGPDLLYYDREYEVLAVDEGSRQVHLSKEIDLRGVSSWTVDGIPAQVSQITSEVYQIDPPALVHPDAVLCQRQFLSSTAEVHQDLMAHWSQRWNALVQPTEEEWRRITGFFVAFLPTIHFDLPPITLTHWKAALKRSTPRAARGLDGISSKDLQHLPDNMTQELLQLLHDIEHGHLRWPLQLLQGIVICLAKQVGAHEAGQFRPVVIFGTVYRTWASIRSKQLINQLHAYIPGSSYGFLPNSECSQVWLQLQATIEMALVENSPWCGLNTDLRRAFNTIPRDHSQRLAQQLGVPPHVLTPWRWFMDNCQRRFQVGQYLSDSLSSTVGVPEGCALSVYMMVQLSMSMHVYLKHFHPTVWTTSYVDNLGLAAASVHDIAGAWVCLQEFLSLWRMEPDLGKSYVWATQPEQRKQLRSFDIAVVQHATELGGAMSFSKRHSQSHLSDRCKDLEMLWKRLRASMAPQRQKLYALRAVVWPKALHGIDAHLVPSSKFAALRSKALQVLKLNKAGVNPLLRLTFSGNFEHDPEYFHIKRTIGTFRRLCLKEPLLVQHWKQFMVCFNGKLMDGPFSKMLSLFSQLSWSLHPPWFTDHDGIEHNLLSIDERILHLLLEEAWCQQIPLRCPRTSMKQLCGIDVPLMHWVSAGLTALDTSLVASLHAGAFISGASQAKFDFSKASVCQFCECKDTHEHWPGCPGYAGHHADVLDIPEMMTASESTRAHLLTSRNADATRLKHWLKSLGMGKRRLSAPGEGPQHLFCDGSGARHANPYLCRAAWACVNASTGLLLSVGHVPGLWQGNDLAELHGLHACLDWACHHMVVVHIWSDSKFIVDAAKWLWQNRRIPIRWAHRELWQQIVDYMNLLDSHKPCFHWVPSHVDPNTSQDPFEDWWIQWNARADEAARLHNDSRGSHYWQLFDAAAQWHDEQCSVLGKLRAFFLDIAKKSGEATTRSPLPELPEPESRVDLDPLLDYLNIGWEQQCVQIAREKGIFPCQFYVKLLQWLLDHEAVDAERKPVSFLEVTFGLIGDKFEFPFQDDGHWRLSKLVDRFERPTLAYCLGIVRKAFRFASRELGFADLCCGGICLSSFKVSMPCDGLVLGLQQSALTRCREALLQFCESRSIRRACDLARPIV